jgi:hypothetical protein
MSGDDETMSAGGFDSGFDVDVTTDDSSAPVVQDSPEPVAKADSAPAQDDRDDIDKASNLDELKAALKKRSPTKEDRSAIDARLAGMSEMERELVELRAWRKAKEEAATPKKEPEKPVDEWDELLGKGPEYINSKAEAAAKREAEALRKEIEAIRGELTERDRKVELGRQVKSREALLQKYPDAHETLLKFRELVKQYPGLEERALAAEDPAAYAYEQQKRYESMSKYQSYEDMIRGEAARLAGGQGAAPVQQAPAQAKPQQRRPLTLAAVRGGNAAVAVDESDGFPNF